VGTCGYTAAAAQAAGYDVVTSLDRKLDKPDYMGGTPLLIKAVAEKSTGRLLGAQVLGQSGVDKRIDIFVTAIYAGLAAADLAQLDLAYSPPFAPARDPLLYTGLILGKQVRDKE
jgi:pyruvate/2-oxoglutarate dehydrogenase complex dihydrolipoamide dehydrogenase (E3) component